MAKLIQEINLEVSKPNRFQAIVAKQYDSDSRFLKVTLVNCGEKIEIKETSTTVINANRSDGASKSFLGESNGDGTATVPLNSWMLELDGDLICDVSIVDTENARLTSTSFTVLVEKAASGEVSGEPAGDILTSLLDAEQAATNAAESANTAAESANAAAEEANRAAETARDLDKANSLVEQNNMQTFKYWVGTQEEYKDQKDSMSEYTFCIITDDHSEEEIWDAINGKASAGYGYGEAAMVITVSSQADLETQLNTIIDGMKNNTSKQVVINDSSFLVTTGLFTTIHRISPALVVLTTNCASYGGTELKKVKKDGTWNDWEWVNPPMYSSVEYRTTERYNGVPVYTKLVTFSHDALLGDATATTRENIPHGIDNIGSLLSIEIVKAGYDFPYLSSTTGGFTKVESVNAADIVLCNHKMSWNASTWRFLMKYTKA